MVLLVIDTQNLVVNPTLYAFDTFVHNIQTLIAAARANHIEVIYVRHEDEALIKGTQSHEIYDKFKPMPNEMIFDKKVNSAFKETLKRMSSNK